MFYDIVFIILVVVFSGIFFGILSDIYLKRDAKKRAENRNDRGAVPIAVVIMIVLAHIGVATFIFKDAVRDRLQAVKTTQILRPVREIDPNGPKI